MKIFSPFGRLEVHFKLVSLPIYPLYCLTVDISITTCIGYTYKTTCKF